MVSLYLSIIFCIIKIEYKTFVVYLESDRGIFNNFENIFLNWNSYFFPCTFAFQAVDDCFVYVPWEHSADHRYDTSVAPCVVESQIQELEPSVI